MAVDDGHHVVIVSLEKAEPVAWWRGDRVPEMAPRVHRWWGAGISHRRDVATCGLLRSCCGANVPAMFLGCL